MTTLNEAKDAIYQRFLDNFTGVTQDRITFDNEEFESPDTGNWVRLVVRDADRVQDTLGRKGNRRFLSTALLLIQIYTRFNTGTKDSDALAEEARNIYEGETFSNIYFNGVVARGSGAEGPWYLTIVEGEFDYEETK